jgi:hypothetical protein
LAAFQSTDDHSDLSVSNFLVVDPEVIEPRPSDVNLPEERREYADPSEDLRARLTGNASMEVEVSKDTVKWKWAGEINSNSWSLGAMWLVSVALVISAAVAVGALVVGHTALAVIFSIASCVCVAGMVGTVVHRWCRKR